MGAQNEPTQPTPGATCNHPGCTEPAWTGNDDGRCLYHSPANGRHDDHARQVWRAARETILQGQPGHFAGWHFPPDPDRQGFAGQRFVHGANFSSATFHGEATFRQAAFEDVTVFDGATFLGLADFSDAAFGQFAAFDGVTFAGRANFSQAGFDGEAWFIGTTFAAAADFLNARFASTAAFNSALFRGNASFSYVTFRSAAHFQHATFAGMALFSVPGANLPAEVHFDLPAWEVPWRKPAPFAQREQGEQAYRLAKQTAQSHGDFRRAGEYHYAEQCAIHFGRRKQVGRRFWQPAFWWYWLEHLFARGLLGYGEKPTRVLLAGLVVILCAAAMFWATAGIVPGDCPADAPYHATFNECLHFSAVTFTTVGYGDYKPKANARLWADCEAFIGAAFMAMFVVALTRKYMR